MKKMDEDKAFIITMIDQFKDFLIDAIEEGIADNFDDHFDFIAQSLTVFIEVTEDSHCDFGIKSREWNDDLHGFVCEMSNGKTEYAQLSKIENGALDANTGSWHVELYDSKEKLKAVREHILMQFKADEVINEKIKELNDETAMIALLPEKPYESYDEFISASFDDFVLDSTEEKPTMTVRELRQALFALDQDAVVDIEKIKLLMSLK